MTQPQKQKADRRRETAPTSRRPGPINTGPAALLEGPDLLALQHAVADPAMATAADTLALQRRYGNQAVQRLIARRQDGAERFEIDGETAGHMDPSHGGGQALESTRQLREPGHSLVQRIRYRGGQIYETDGSTRIDMEPRLPQRGANCHGHTYGTWKMGEHQNPNQMSAGGVKRIISEEAGDTLDNVTVPASYINQTPPPSFNVLPVAGNLIVCWDNGGVPYHSAKVVSAKGRSWADVVISNKWGYEGSISNQKLSETGGLGEGTRVRLYPRTPETRLDVSEKAAKLLGVGS